VRVAPIYDVHANLPALEAVRHTPYDCEAAAARILAKPGPLAERFAERVLAAPPAHTAVERWGNG
jgi:hypothetical protein